MGLLPDVLGYLDSPETGLELEDLMGLLSLQHRCANDRVGHGTVFLWRICPHMGEPPYRTQKALYLFLNPRRREGHCFCSGNTHNQRVLILVTMGLEVNILKGKAQTKKFLPEIEKSNLRKPLLSENRYSGTDNSALHVRLFAVNQCLGKVIPVSRAPFGLYAQNPIVTESLSSLRTDEELENHMGWLRSTKTVLSCAFLAKPVLDRLLPAPGTSGQGSNTGVPHRSLSLLKRAIALKTMYHFSLLLSIVDKT
ncbi:MAG: hypothetical protein Q7K38_01695 [Candidatus Wildermuthbacteria bacterium]|nr:hypothetical protein [Candidatus Wildermuthbacteria bacterium]